MCQMHSGNKLYIGRIHLIYILLSYNITLFDVNHIAKYIIVDLFLLIMMAVCSETFS